MPPVSHGNTPLSMAPNLVRHPLKASVVRGTRMRRWSTFTPPRHAANAARCGLFSLRRSYIVQPPAHHLPKLQFSIDGGKHSLNPIWLSEATEPECLCFEVAHAGSKRRNKR